MTKRKSYAAVVNAPQPQSVQTSPEQIRNNAGGFVYAADMWTRLNRFLVLGTESNSYYVNAEQKTFQAYDVIQSCLKADGFRTVDMAVKVSQEGIAPKNDAALWVMALACSPKYASADVVKYALANMRLVARTLSYLYQFIEMVQQSRGWGRGLRAAVSNWFDEMGFHGTTYQAIKYRQRNGWTGRDVLRLAHPKFNNAELNAIYRWLTNGMTGMSERKVKRVAKSGSYTQEYPSVAAALPPIVKAFEAIQQMQKSGTVVSTADWEVSTEIDPTNILVMLPIEQGKTVVDEAVRLINKFGLTWEMLPTEMLTEAKIWAALIPNLPYTALMRNLANMTRSKVFANRELLTLVCDRLKNEEAIIRARIHPINILAAQMTYAQGKGMKGQNTWEPERRIVEALQDAFPLAFKGIAATGKRILVALDISGSMEAKVNGMEYLSCIQASAALAVSILGSEPDADCVNFNSVATRSELSPRNRLDVSMKYMEQVNDGSTNCAAPFNYALKQLDSGAINSMYDAVILITDTQTWIGNAHTDVAIAKCRQRNPAMRVVEVALEVNEFTLEKENPLTLRIAGLDSSAPKLINEFLLGNV